MIFRVRFSESARAFSGLVELIKVLIEEGAAADWFGWTTWAKDTSVWLRGLDAMDEATMDEVERVSKLVIPRSVINRRQDRLRMEVADDTRIVFSVIEDAKKRVVRRVRQGGVCVNRSSRVERAGV